MRHPRCVSWRDASIWKHVNTCPGHLRRSSLLSAKGRRAAERRFFALSVDHLKTFDAVWCYTYIARLLYLLSWRGWSCTVQPEGFSDNNNIVQDKTVLLPVSSMLRMDALSKSHQDKCPHIMLGMPENVSTPFSPKYCLQGCRRIWGV